MLGKRRTLWGFSGEPPSFTICAEELCPHTGARLKIIGGDIGTSLRRRSTAVWRRAHPERGESSSDGEIPAGSLSVHEYGLRPCEVCSLGAFVFAKLGRADSAIAVPLVELRMTGEAAVCGISVYWDRMMRG